MRAIHFNAFDPNLVRIRPVQVEAEEIPGARRSGQADLAFGCLPGLGAPEFESVFLLSDWFLRILRRGHPWSGRALMLGTIGGLDFVEVSAHAAWCATSWSATGSSAASARGASISP